MKKIVSDNLNTNIWFNFKEFYKYIASKKFDTLVEVGVWKGHSVSFLAKEMRSMGLEPTIYAVDLWEDTYKWEGNDSLRRQVPHLSEIYSEIKKQNGVSDMITDIKGISWEMAEKFDDNSIDFVFIDADHSYESVIKDINAWLPKIRKGGIISGHDYNKEVKRAVDETFKNIKVSGTCWYTEI